MMGIKHCRLIDLPKFSDMKGNLTVIESEKHVPFEIKRTFYLYDVPINEKRAGHAHKDLQQFLIAVSGSFDFVINDGYESRQFYLNQPYQGIYVCPMIWGELKNFSSSAVCLVLASDYYDESKYYRNYDTYLMAIKSK